MRLAQSAPVDVEPEAQLTSPVKDLLERIAASQGIDLRLLREAQMDGVRPDFVAVVAAVPCGWVELKAPGHTVDGSLWRGRERRQWELLRELDSLLVCNGQTVRLYVLGEQDGPDVELPFTTDHVEQWSSADLVELLRRFTSARPPTIARVSQLAERLAPMARLLRDRLLAALAASTPIPPVVAAAATWRGRVHHGATDAEIASDLAQVVAYGLAIAALQPQGADLDSDGRISLREAQQVLERTSSGLAATVGLVLNVPGFADVVASEIGALERLVSALDRSAIARNRDPRGEPWLWFYEDFLARYDPQARRQAGVYYTPLPVVHAQVRLTDHILREHLNRPLGFGDRGVTTLDPATGSGTYPLAVIDHAAAVANQVRGPAGPAQVAPTLAANLVAFELLPGPYAVAHLRIGQRIVELEQSLLTVQDRVRVYLTDTLDDYHTLDDPTLFGAVRRLADERVRAAAVKEHEAVQVVIGNPPYRREAAHATGGWMHTPLVDDRTPFADVIGPAQDAGVIFSAQASLYNLYVYFWRWALWKAFQQNPRQPAVVSFITGSSWLSRPVFCGLRQLARELADEIWVVDLGGEGRGAVQEENVFTIQTPVAIVTLFRRGATRKTTATVHYQRITGSRAAKLEALDAVAPPDEQPSQWTEVPGGAGDPLSPRAGAAQQWAALTDLFCWQQPGVKFNRTWPVAPDPHTLRRRWDDLLAARDPTERAARFVTGSSGRNIHTQVGSLPRLADLPPGAEPEPAVRFGYRSFDREWTFDDPRLAKTESPALWRSLSDQQIFLSSMTTSPLGAGPALTVALDVPDLHHFRGSYGGKDVLPVYRTASGQPNLPAGLLDRLAEAYGEPVTVDQLAAYVYALLSTPGYQQRFAEQLAEPGPRVPITADPDLWREAVAAGSRLLWLHTFTHRYRDPAAGRGPTLPVMPGLGWTQAVRTLPVAPADIRFDPPTGVVHVGTGTVGGVSAAVWDYSVSGYQVVPAWLGRRTRRGTGRAATRPAPLDRIRPEEWYDEWNDELLDLLRVLTLTVGLRPDQDDLLDRITAGPLLDAATLPIPSPAERAVPPDEDLSARNDPRLL